MISKVLQSVILFGIRSVQLSLPLKNKFHLAMTGQPSGTCSESLEKDQIKDHLLEEVKPTTTDLETMAG